MSRLAADFTKFSQVHTNRINLAIHFLFVPQIFLAIFGILVHFSQIESLQFLPIGIDFILFGLLTIAYLLIDVTVGVLTSLWVFGLLVAARVIYNHAVLSGIVTQVVKMFYGQIFICLLMLIIGQKEFEGRLISSHLMHLLTIARDPIYITTLALKLLGFRKGFFLEIEHATDEARKSQEMLEEKLNQVVVELK